MSWDKTTLGKIADISTGKSNVVDSTDTGLYPFYDRSQQVKYSNRFLFDVPNAIIVPGEGTKFIPRMAHGKFDLHQRAYAIIPNNSVSAEYVYYAILNAHDYFTVVSTGSTVPSLRLGMFENMPIALPDLPTQLRIAGVLGSLDEKIALNRKKIAELEALAKTIYDYWFVQFDFPDKDGKPYKSSGGKMVWNEQLKREVPEGWAVELLPQIADYLFGNPFDSSLFTSSGKGFPIVRIRNVKDGFTSDRTTESASKEYIIHNGDFLIGMDGYFDMNHWIGGDAYLVQRSCRVNAKDDLYSVWLSMSLVSPIKHLETSLTGATLAHLGKAHLDKIVLPKPPTSMSNALSFLNNLLKQKVHWGIANLELVRQRDELLPLLMNGQVVVK